MKSRHLSLPKRKAEFIEPMECAPVTKLLDAESLRAETDAQLDKALELIRTLSDPPHADCSR